MSKEEYPNTAVSGCQFHLSQSILRKVGDVGLKGLYDNDPNFNILVKSLSALAFVPENEVGVVFNDLVGKFPANDDAVDDLLVYYGNIYVHGVQVGNRPRAPKFPPFLWNHTVDALFLEPKTTNAVEGFHNGLNSLFNISTPIFRKNFGGWPRT